MLVEAATLIRELHSGELTTWEGDYFRIDPARIWDAPEGGVPIAMAVSGAKSVDRFAPLAEHLVAVEPDADLVKLWDKTKKDKTSRKIGQIPICRGKDKDVAIAKAHDQFRWFAGATQYVRPEDVVEQIPCGPDLDAIVEAIQPYWEAGFTDIAVVQVGDEGQSKFLAEAAGPLLDKLRAAAG